MGDPEIYTLTEDKQLMDAYDSINEITRYQKIGCGEMNDTKNSKYYEDMINDLDENYNEIITQYARQFENYKMSLAKQDFFTEKDGTDVEFDKALGLSVFSKNVTIKNPTNAVGANKPPGVGSVDDAKQKLFDRSDDIYKKSMNYGEQWADQNWYNGNPLSGTTSLKEVNNLEVRLENIQQQLSGVKVNLENDIHSLESCINIVNEEIDKIELQNQSLRRKISFLKSDKATGEGKLYDSQKLYNQYNLGNWVVGIIVLFVVYKTIKCVVMKQRIVQEGVKNVQENAANITNKVSTHVNDLKNNGRNMN